MTTTVSNLLSVANKEFKTFSHLPQHIYFWEPSLVLACSYFFGLKHFLVETSQIYDHFFSGFQYYLYF